MYEMRDLSAGNICSFWGLIFKKKVVQYIYSKDEGRKKRWLHRVFFIPYN